MFSIEKYDLEKEAKILSHSPNVFHEALADGDEYYHVSNPMGEDYDIAYKGNMDWFADIIPAYAGKVLSDYRSYDEYDTESLELITFNGYEQLLCMQATEYSIAIARIALCNTNLPVYFMDPRATWFLPKSDRLFIGQKPSEAKNTLMLVGGRGRSFTKGLDVRSNSPMSDIFVFNSLFWVQTILGGKKISEIKYLEFPYANGSMGIGGMLVKIREAQEIAQAFGWKLVYNGEKIGKFHVKDLIKFYKLDFSCLDSTPENTAVLELCSTLNTVRRGYEMKAVLDDSILQENFRNELAEYEEAVLSGHRTLGLLMRGTDYISSGINKVRKQATVEQMLPMVYEWIEDGNYDRVFLATEDQDILKKMREALGNKLIAVAQERHSVKEFDEGQIINELEKQIYSENEYNERVIETTINYFYALHILSNCQAFLCSGQNNGWDTVLAMNGDKFEKAERYKF